MAIKRITASSDDDDPEMRRLLYRARFKSLVRRFLAKAQARNSLPQLLRKGALPAWRIAPAGRERRASPAMPSQPSRPQLASPTASLASSRWFDCSVGTVVDLGCPFVSRWHPSYELRHSRQSRNPPLVSCTVHLQLQGQHPWPLGLLTADRQMPASKLSVACRLVETLAAALQFPPASSSMNGARSRASPSVAQPMHVMPRLCSSHAATSDAATYVSRQGSCTREQIVAVTHSSLGQRTD